MLSNFFSRILPRGKKASSRDAKIAEIESLGFTLRDLRGWHQGKFAERRYHLVDRDGTEDDNRGEGYRSSSAALTAARLTRQSHEQPPMAPDQA